ncbi:MAG: hypothetical protein KF726_07110 [Anaerolineae bacterium]|nr:hypothetical protein [Anaerolineae bacterium]
MLQRLPAALRVFGSALIDWWDAWLPLMWINLATTLSLLLILPGPPAIFGMYVAANELVHGRYTTFQDFTNGARRYFWKSWLWALPNIVVGVLGAISLVFYNRLSSDLGAILQGLVVVVLVLWCAVQFYALPFLIEQHEKRLLLAWRNALFAVLATPPFTLLFLILAMLILFLSVASVALVFLGGLCLFALYGTRAVFNRLDTFGIRERDAKRAEQNASDER